MELKSLLDPEVIDLVAKKHWERKSHPMMEKAGYATDWINLSKSLKREYRNIAIRIIKTAFSAAENDQVFAGCFKGEKIFTTKKTKQVIDCLQGQINRLMADKNSETNSENEFTGVGFG